jgi:hypothetical protein
LTLRKIETAQIHRSPFRRSESRSNDLRPCVAAIVAPCVFEIRAAFSCVRAAPRLAYADGASDAPQH